MYDPKADRVIGLALQHGHTQRVKIGAAPSVSTAFMRLHLRGASEERAQRLHAAFALGASLLDNLCPQDASILLRTRVEGAISTALANVLVDGNFAADTLPREHAYLSGHGAEGREVIETAHDTAVVRALEFLNG